MKAKPSALGGIRVIQQLLGFIDWLGMDTSALLFAELETDSSTNVYDFILNKL